MVFVLPMPHTVYRFRYRSATDRAAVGRSSQFYGRSGIVCFHISRCFRCCARLTLHGTRARRGPHNLCSGCSHQTNFFFQIRFVKIPAVGPASNIDEFCVLLMKRSGGCGLRSHLVSRATRSLHERVTRSRNAPF